MTEETKIPTIPMTDKKPQFAPSFFRLTVMLEENLTNRNTIVDIIAYAESRLTSCAGGRLIKIVTENVHAIETYGSTWPTIPKPQRTPVDADKTTPTNPL